MAIILEGPENAGKTTLADTLYDAIDGANIHHHGPYARYYHVFKHYADDALADNHLIMDRSWYSEAIYGNALRGRDRIGANTRSLDRAALGSHSMVVRCLPDRTRCVGRDDPHVKAPGDRARVYDRFAEWQPPIPHVDFDWETDDPLEVLRYLRLREAAQRKTPPYGTGNWTDPRVVLVGDRPNYAPWHAFMTDRGCTAWLNERLEEAQIPEDQLAWVNASLPDGTPASKPRWPENATVVALGARADAWLERIAPRKEFIRFDHPQYHRRFLAGQDYHLIEYLETRCTT